MRTMLKLTPRCNFCLLIIHTFLERAQPAGRMQAAVRSGHLRDGRQDPAVAGPRAMLQHTYGQCL